MGKEDISIRIETYRKRSDISKAEMARALGVDPGSFGNILRGSRSVTSDLIIKFLEIYSDVSPEWFLFGRGEMSKGEGIQPDLGLVPDLPIEAAAGFSEDLERGIAPSMCAMLPRIPGLPSYDLTISVRGDSMAPAFQSGDRLAIRRCYDIVEWGRPHVLDTTEGVYLKRIRDSGDSVLCLSDNPEYSPFPIPKQCVRALYKVVALLRVC